MNTRSGDLTVLFLDWIKDNPEYLTSYANDLFVTDYSRFVDAAESSDETVRFLLGMRSTGTHMFRLGEAFDPKGSMGAARLEGEVNDRYGASQWFMVEVSPRSEHFNGSQVYGTVTPIDSAEKARSIAQMAADGHTMEPTENGFQLA